MSFLSSLLLSLLLSGVSVCVDPGHGGSSSGAVGEYALEKDVVLEIGLLLQNWLCQVPGITRVSLTREGDYHVSLQARTDYANSQGFDLFVSIHENAFNGSVQGTETFCGSLDPADPSFQMASLVQQGILSAYGYTDRGVKDGSYLHVIRETEMPAVLGEGSFLDYDLNWNESYLYAFDIDDHTGIQAWQYADAFCSFYGLSAPQWGNGVALIDDGSAGFSVNDSTLWQNDPSGAPWMGNCLVSQGGGQGTALWTSPLPVHGTRDLQLWWTSGADRTASATYVVHHSGGSSTFQADQLAEGGGEWYSAGTYDFSGEFSLELTCSESGPGTVVADAVRLVYPMGTGCAAEPGFQVSANPAASFTFTFPHGDQGSVQIVDLSGRIVSVVSGSGSAVWDPTDRPSGLYFAVDGNTGQSAGLVLLR